MNEISYRLEDLSCPDCAQKLGHILEKQKGIQQANVSYATSKLKIQYDANQISLEEIEKIIAKTGYKVLEKR